MTSRKWVLRSPIIWHRDKALPESVGDRPHRSYEYIFMFAKNRKYYFDRQPLIDKQIDEDVWTITPRPSGTEIDTATVLAPVSFRIEKLVYGNIKHSD